MLVVLSLDGLGIADAGEFNAVSRANMPFLHELLATYPSVRLSIPDSSIDIFSCAERYALIGDCCDGRSIIDILERYSMSSLLLSGSNTFFFLKDFFAGSRVKECMDSILIDIRPLDENSKDFVNLIEPISKVLEKNIIDDGYDFLMCSIDAVMRVARGADVVATVSCLEILDYAIEKISRAVLSMKGTLFITSPYGCAESLGFGEVPALYGSVTANSVPLILVDSKWEGRSFGREVLVGSDLMLLSVAGELRDLSHMCLSVFGLDDPHIKKIPILKNLL